MRHFDYLRERSFPYLWALNFYPFFFPSNPTRQISIRGLVNSCERLHKTTSRRKSENLYPVLPPRRCWPDVGTVARDGRLGRSFLEFAGRWILWCGGFVIIAGPCVTPTAMLVLPWPCCKLSMAWLWRRKFSASSPIVFSKLESLSSNPAVSSRACDSAICWSVTSESDSFFMILPSGGGGLFEITRIPLRSWYV